jgi:hypothetical protein
MKQKFGLFLLFVGFILLVTFFAVDRSTNPRPDLFFLGLGGIIVGGYMTWHYRPPAGPNERFRTVRSVMERRQNPKKK